MNECQICKSIPWETVGDVLNSANQQALSHGIESLKRGLELTMQSPNAHEVVHVELRFLLAGLQKRAPAVEIVMEPALSGA